LEDGAPNLERSRKYVIFEGRSDLDMRNIAEIRRNKQMPTEKKAASKRELIEPTKGDKRYVRRKADGTFGKTVDVGKSLSADRKHSAKTKVPEGQGDRGDVKK
jgi:hypothetical protein